MAKKKNLSLNLSQEEVFVILGYLGFSAMPGWDPTVFTELNEEQARMVIGVAERGLMARGLLLPGPEGRLKLTDIPNALVGTCVSPDESLVINFNYQDRPSIMRFFHTARAMKVLHDIPISGIHHFVAFDSRDALTLAALSILELEEPEKSKKYSASISEDLIVTARTAAEEAGVSNAVEVLNQNGFSGDAAEAFASSLADPTFNHTIVHIQHRNGEPIEEGFSLLAGADYLWLLTPLIGDGMVHLKTAVVDEIAEILKSYLLK